MENGYPVQHTIGENGRILFYRRICLLFCLRKEFVQHPREVGERYQMAVNPNKSAFSEKIENLCIIEGEQFFFVHHKEAGQSEFPAAVSVCRLKKSKIRL
ncbi:MAG: hypothetical protein MUO63_18175 [Desulfobulbaceae bacterium]|nr:hypothetical protein [Desulfobulbaceae bacterium]